MCVSWQQEMNILHINGIFLIYEKDIIIVLNNKYYIENGGHLYISDISNLW